jgi:mono/diheme cytochrome c family protein
LEVHDANGDIVRVINLGGDSRADTGFDLFQGDPDSSSSEIGNVTDNITCASCHPEGGDDGHVWSFDVGLRRTMSLAGNVTQRAPFHWKGDLRDMSAIMHDIFTVRMGGAPQNPARVSAITNYLATIPPLPSVGGLDSDAVSRGQTLFQSADTQCTECHTGSQLTNRAIVDVGTGETFKVPSLLGLGMRAPYLHDGSALTLADRFKVQGGGDKHGHTSQLTSAQVSDLVTYLSSL